MKCKWENEVQIRLCCFHLKFIITLISQVSTSSVNLFETFMVPFSLMASYDTLHMHLFRAGVSAALAEEGEIRNTLWSLKCIYIYFILVLASFGKVNVGVFSYIIYSCFWCVYLPFQLTVSSILKKLFHYLHGDLQPTTTAVFLWVEHIL